MNQNKKPWERRKGSSKRVIGKKNIAEKILIVCEGEKTEPNYFKAFPVDTEVVKLDVEGAGRNTDSLVDYAIERQAEVKGEKLFHTYFRFTLYRAFCKEVVSI